MVASFREIQVVDSHTGGEPTRLVLAGGPDLPAGTLPEKLAHLRTHHDSFRSAVVNEPRGSDPLVGALLCAPSEPSCSAGVIFFNNVGYLGMCGHGTIGVVATLAYLGRLKPGTYPIDTPVGVVTTRLDASGAVTVRSVPSFRTRTNIAVQVEGYGRVSGDVAWGGNWFFLVGQHGQSVELSKVEELTDFAGLVHFR